MDALITPIQLLGISAPRFSWCAAAVVVIIPLWHILRLFKLYYSQSGVIRRLSDDIQGLAGKYPRKGNEGLNSQAIDRLYQLFANIPSIATIWNDFRSKLIYRQNKSDGDGYQVWQSESSREIFSEDVLLGPNFDKRLFHSIPGIVTGIGLLMTFVAILVGLMDVRIVHGGKQVEGLGNLINGMSGKFVSSVFALLAATIFLFVEKHYFQKLNKVRHTLINAIDSLIPRRSEAHILEEISQNIVEQTSSFRTFNSDLSHKLKNSFSESMGPTLDRMVLAIEDLNHLTNSSKAELLETLKEMNKSRQDSISGQVEFLLKDLQKSLSDSINKMSSEFSTSLTGTAQEQFKRVADTVGATAEVLEGMNKQFSESRLALQELIALAKQSTESQFSNSSVLIERMVDMIGGTMVKMEEQITCMSSKMTSTIEGTAERSAEAAGGIISEVRALNEQTVQKFVETLQKHEHQLDRVDALKTSLQSATVEFGEYVTGYNTINKDLKAASQEANSVLQLLAQSSKTFQQSQDAFGKVASLAMDKINLLADSNDSQKELWQDIANSMDEYKKTFSTIESSAGKILSNISDHLQDFSKSTQSHLNQTVAVANEHINKAVGQLGVSIESLGEKLEDLNDIVDRIPKG
ncbi:MAG: hypothetical protein WCP20_18200 [Desulfuromonadales bacterium]